MEEWKAWTGAGWTWCWGGRLLVGWGGVPAFAAERGGNTVAGCGSMRALTRWYAAMSSLVSEAIGCGCIAPMLVVAVWFAPMWVTVVAGLGMPGVWTTVGGICFGSVGNPYPDGIFTHDAFGDHPAWIDLRMAARLSLNVLALANMLVMPKGFRHSGVR